MVALDDLRNLFGLRITYIFYDLVVYQINHQIDLIGRHG